MLISEVRESQNQPASPGDNRPRGRARHPFVAWAIASLRIMWLSARHPGQPCMIDYRTGDVWLCHQPESKQRKELC